MNTDRLFLGVIYNVSFVIDKVQKKDEIYHKRIVLKAVGRNSELKKG